MNPQQIQALIEKLQDLRARRDFLNEEISRLVSEREVLLLEKAEVLAAIEALKENIE